MLTQEIRRHFLRFFKERGHAIIASSPVLPYDDPTLLFTNAGMNQFKDVFLGESVRDYKRAATSQKCIRVGGKHNDLDNVGHTRRHLTFFEMLGNFSFGDYFKKEAIQFAWEMATEVFGFAPEKLWPTVFRGDDEAFELWTRYVPPERITRFEEKHNFWMMGETGPCGPCSELLFDRGERYGSATKPIEDVEEERYLEFWNLVFMQYNRKENGEVDPLPNPSIDTGAGLERIVSLKLDVDTVFETDVLRSLIAQVEQISGIAYEPDNATQAPAFRVIADHMRCLAFAIADGVQPSNVERGYVLRKVLRRAVRYGRSLGMEKPFLAKVLPRLVETMGEDYPELIKGQERIAEILTSEEETFIRTLRRGGNILNQIMERAAAHHKHISGDDAFKLKDTYGFPLEEILLLAKDADLVVDVPRYQELEEEAKERSRRVHKTTKQVAAESQFAEFAEKHGKSEFLGYTQHAAIGKILGLVSEGEFVDQLKEGEEGIVILDKTSFYAEMGGQIGDTGTLKGEHQSFLVKDCQAPFKGVIGHIGKMTEGELHVGDTVTAVVDRERRQRIANNHTATHLLHWALQKILGEHVKQAGSVVEPRRLRFDFSHHKAVTSEEVCAIEDLVNTKIRENLPVRWYELSYDEVQKREDIKQFFGEKYDRVVRVVDIDYSKELCGGTHTSALGNIGLFRITKESSIAAGMRRIEAVTGKEAEELSRQSEEALFKLSSLLKTQQNKVEERVEKLLEENRQLAQEIKNVKRKELESFVSSLVSKVEMIQEIPLLAAEVKLNSEEMRFCAEETFAKMKKGVLVLASAMENRCSILVRLSNDLIEKGIKANDIVKEISPIIEGSGGGKANQAQAGGKAPQKIPEALAQVREFLTKMN